MTKEDGRYTYPAPSEVTAKEPAFKIDMEFDAQVSRGSGLLAVSTEDLEGWGGFPGDHFLSFTGINPGSGKIRYADTGWSSYAQGSQGDQLNGEAWNPNGSDTFGLPREMSTDDFFRHAVMSNLCLNGRRGDCGSAPGWPWWSEMMWTV